MILKKESAEKADFDRQKLTDFVVMRPGTEAANPPEPNPAKRSGSSRSNFHRRLSRPDASECRRFADRTEVFESPFERRIQQFETEIDFSIGRRQWRGDAHDPIGCAGAHDVGAQSEMQSLIGDGIGERACRVRLPGAKCFEFYS